MKKYITLLLLLCLSQTILVSQQMSKRPLIVFGEISSIRPENTEGISTDLNYGEIVVAMLQTAVHDNYVFAVSGQTSPSLQQARNTFSNTSTQVFYIEGTAYKLNTVIQADIRIYNVKTNTLVHSDYFSVRDENRLRQEIAAMVKDLANRLFRDILGSLTVRTSGKGADVFLDDIFCGTTNSNGEFKIAQLYPGDYKLRILAEGYTEYNVPISIVPRGNNQVQASLRSEPGSMTVQSTPSNAEVSLNGQVLGKTPIEIPSLEVGDHRLQIELDGHKRWIKTVSIASRQNLGITAELEIRPGNLRITTDPIGAEVYLGGSFLGETPITGFELPAGNYGLEVRHNAFYSENRAIEIIPGQYTDLEIVMNPITAKVDIEANVNGAEVFVSQNGKQIYQGQTPIRNIELPYGTYTVSLTASGYTSETKRISITNDDFNSMNFELQPKPGTLVIESYPHGGIVFINGEKKGVTPLVITELKAGDYEIEIENSVASHREFVTIGPNEVIDIDVNLEKQESLLLPALILTSIAGISFFISGVQ